MVNQKLISYIKSQLSKGVPIRQIKKKLLSRGWSKIDVDSAMNLATKKYPTTPQNKKLKNKYSKWKIITIVVIVALISSIIVLSFSMKRGDSSETSTPETGNNLPSHSESSKVLDCEEDMDCFIEASEDCTPAKLSSTSTIELFGMVMVTSGFSEIKGEEEGKCVYYMRTENYEMHFSDEMVQQMLATGVTQEEIQQQEEETNEEYLEPFEGKDGICKFNKNSDLTNILIKAKEGTFSLTASCSTTENGFECTSSNDWDVAECEGELFETS